MSNVQSYNALIDRFKAFASGHFILKTFSHGQIDTADLEKFTEYPFMHVVPSNVTYAKGTKTFSFQIVLADLPRDKDDKVEFQREVLSDLQRIAEDLVAEITNHRVLFGDLITVQNVSLEPFLEEFHNTLTGWTVSLELLVPYYWDACSIPAEWNDFFESGSGGTGSILTFIDSIVRDEYGNVSLVNDEAEPAPNYYYGTNEEGVRGWYLLTDEVGLTCETIGDCQTIIDIEAAIDALEEEVALKADITSISAVGFSNNYDDLDNKPTIPTGLTVGTTSITGGAVGRVLFEGADNLLQESNNFVWDNALNRLGINTTPTTTFQVAGISTMQSIVPSASATYDIGAVGNYYSIGFIQTVRNNNIRMISNAGGTSFQDASANTLMKLFGTTGNFGINTTTDAGYKLDVNGSARFGTSFYWDNTNNRLGIGTNSPLGILHLKETAQTTRFLMDGDAGQSKIITFRTNGLQRFGLYCNNIAESGSNSGSDLAIRAYTDLGVLLSTPLYIKRSSGNVLINSTTDAGYKLDVNGTARVSGALTVSAGIVPSVSGNGSLGTGPLPFLNGLFAGVVYSNTFQNYNSNLNFSMSGTTVARIFTTTGNVVIQNGGTFTDAGYRLDVNGTARVQGKLSVGTPTATSAVTEITSTTQGFLPPRMTTTQKNAIATPAAGLMVYDTTLNLISVYNGTTWITL